MTKSYAKKEARNYVYKNLNYNFINYKAGFPPVRHQQFLQPWDSAKTNNHFFVSVLKLDKVYLKTRYFLPKTDKCISEPSIGVP